MVLQVEVNRPCVLEFELEGVWIVLPANALVAFPIRGDERAGERRELGFECLPLGQRLKCDVRRSRSPPVTGHAILGAIFKANRRIKVQAPLFWHIGEDAGDRVGLGAFVAVQDDLPANERRVGFEFSAEHPLSESLGNDDLIEARQRRGGIAGREWVVEHLQKRGIDLDHRVFEMTLADRH